MGENKIFSIVALILLCVAFVLHLIGWTVPFWAHSKTEIGSSSVELYYGLWQYCKKIETSTTNVNECQDLTDTVQGIDWIKGTQAMEILAFLMFLPAVVLMILKLLVMKDQEMFPKIVMALSFVAGLFALIGIIIFGAETDLVGNWTYHFGFAFTIIGALFGVAAGAVLTVDMVKG